MFKPSYSQEEMKELCEWFQQHKDELPKDMQLNNSTYIPDVARTVDAFLQALKGREINSRMAGLVAHLAAIRDKASEQMSQ